jgi:acetoin utilization deacetylase AcuC-like enzyme
MSEFIPDLDSRAVAPSGAAEWICRVHDEEYRRWVKESCESGQTLLDHGDTAVCARSYEAALASVDAVLTAADAVMSGEVECAFSAMRPPGHHALPARAMGFCIFGNLAILAEYLRERHGIGSIAVVDWDVHHGNGTQHVFWRDPDVLFTSLHQHPLWPGTGMSGECGEGAGQGTTLNIPLPPGTSEAEYVQAFEETVIPALDHFQPDFLLISAGFDAHVDDPIAQLSLTAQAYAHMTRLLKDVAAHHCGGRIISTLEGGYNLDALQRSVAAHYLALRE